jgi:hypothetical protein
VTVIVPDSVEVVVRGGGLFASQKIESPERLHRLERDGAGQIVISAVSGRPPIAGIGLAN